MEEPQNGDANTNSVVAAVEEEEAIAKVAAAVEEEEAVVGPAPAPRSRPKRPLQFEHAYLDALPSANMYATFYLVNLISGCRVIWIFEITKQKKPCSTL